MSKKSFMALMGATIIGSSSLLGLGTSNANAMENPEQSTIESQESFLEILPTDSEKTLVENEIDSPSLFAKFPISHSSLGKNEFVKSSSSYVLKKGENVKLTSATWNPAGQDIQIGLVNEKTGEQKWSAAYSGGSVSSKTIEAPSAGNWYIAIGTPSSNTKSISVNAQFDL